MAIVFMEGFDMYSGSSAPAGWRSRFGVNTSNGITLPEGRFGVGKSAGHSGQSGRHCWVDFGGTGPRLCVGVAMYHSTPGGTIFMANTEGNEQCGLRLDDDGSVILGRFSSSSSYTELARTPAETVRAGAWHYYEIEIYCADSGGRMALWVDGAKVAEAIDVNTQDYLSDSKITRVYFGGITGGYEYRIDDLYITDTDERVGEARILTLRPIADTEHKAFTPSSGSANYAMVDEQSVSTSDYVSGSNVGDLDLYEMEELPPTASVYALQGRAFASKSDAETRGISLVYEIGGQQYPQADFMLGASGIFGDTGISQANPATGGGWTRPAVNAMRVGPKVTV